MINRQYYILIAVTFIASVFVAQVEGAVVVLRPKATHQGPVVYLGDVADISAETEFEVQDLVTTPLTTAPAPGTQQFLQSAQVRNLLVSRGINVSDLQISGATTVEIGEAPVVEPVMLKPAYQPSADVCRQTIIEVIIDYLEAKTGHAHWRIEVQLSETEIKRLAKLGNEVQVGGGKLPWTGAQRFAITAPDSDELVFVTSQVARLEYVVAAVRRLEQGNLINATDVELRLEKNAPTTSLGSLGQVVGREVARTIDANTILQSSQVRSPLQVQRGEIVKVFARTAGITVSTFAVVQQNGALGDLVQVQTLDKKDRFAARVSGWKQLEVLPTGADATEIATANRPVTQQR